VELGVIGEASDSAPEVLESMPLGAIDFVTECQDFGAWRLGHGITVREPNWLNEAATPRNFIGDCYAMMAEYVLYDYQPYPGDERYTAYDDNRFTLIPHKKYYQIIDSLAEFRVNVPRSLLEKTQFDLGRWYSKRRAKAVHERLPRKRKVAYSFGNPLSIIGSQLLEDGIESNYPSIDPLADPEGRFNLYPSAGNPMEYIVDDAELNLQLPIPKIWLLDPTFDLVSWYRGQLEES